MQPVTGGRRRLFASVEDAEIAFKALEVHRPEDLKQLYDAMVRSYYDGQTVAFDNDMPSLIAFLKELPVMTDEADRRRVAWKLFSQMVDDIKNSGGPRDFRNVRKIK